MILADAHVHIHDCFNSDKCLDAAYSNFQSAAERISCGENFIGVLLLAETSKDNWFNRLSNYAAGKNLPGNKKTQNWTFHRTREDPSLYAKSLNLKNLLLIAGQQIVTVEGLEVLALCTTYRFADGAPIVELVESIKKVDAVPVIPWGFGKWFGTRGKILCDYLRSKKDSDIFLGDNSGRPALLPFPHHFRLAERNRISILPGSDPLPFKTEYDRAGSFGFLLEEEISNTYPAESLKKILLNSRLNVQSYGDLENPFRFFHNQLKMQIKKRYSKYKK